MRLSEVFKPMAQAIEEALKPSEYRQYVKGWDKNRWAELFGGKYRLYLPLLIPSNVSIRDEDEYNEQAKKISSINVTIGAKVSTIDGKKVKTGGTIISSTFGLLQKYREIDKVLSKDGYYIDDYIKGLAITADYKRKVSIGKLLNKYPELKQFYDLDPVRQGNIAQERQMVVISRHPYDIASMSTDRGWTSCMNLHTGSNRKYIPIEIQAGTIIAYLIDKKDKNINNASARVLIKPFVSDDTSETNDDSIVLGIQDKVYGTANDSFINTVNKWVDDVNLSRKMDGVFTLIPGVYDDSGLDKKRFYTQGKKSKGSDYSEKAFKYIISAIEDHDFEQLIEYTNHLKHVPPYIINQYLPKIWKMSFYISDDFDNVIGNLKNFCHLWNTTIDKFDMFDHYLENGYYYEMVPYYEYDIVDVNYKNARKLYKSMKVAGISYGKQQNITNKIVEQNPKWLHYF